MGTSKDRLGNLLEEDVSFPLIQGISMGVEEQNAGVQEMTASTKESHRRQKKQNNVISRSEMQAIHLHHRGKTKYPRRCRTGRHSHTGSLGRCTRQILARNTRGC